jgi:ABC-2 type transport system permease protein
VRWLLVAVMLTVIALVAGMQVGGDAVDVVGLYSLALLVNVAGFAWAAGIAMRFRTVQSGPLMQMPMFLLLFFAPVYVPLDLLSGWIETVATYNPITYVLEAARSLISGEPEVVLLAFALALAMAGVLVVWAVRGLRRAEAAA